jgi:hydrophobe/amphiphile efflux-3 (HAE3) family protein
MFERIVRAAAARPIRVLLVTLLLAVAGGALALTLLRPSAETSTLVGSGSSAYVATEKYRERFGDHAIVILVKGARRDSLPDIVLTKNLGRLLGLEGCIAGNRPAEQAAPGGPSGACAALARTKPVQVVYGPGTFINSAVSEIQDQLKARLARSQQEAERVGEAARKLARSQGKSEAEARKLAESAKQLKFAEFYRDLLQYNVRYGLGLNATPYLNNPDFVAPLVFDSKRGASTPKARFAYLFPNDRSATIQVRLKPDLSEEEREQAISHVRRAVRMPEWQLENGVKYTFTGAPVVVQELSDALSSSILRLLVVALLVTALVLFLVFRSRLRLVPLLVALGASAVLFGLMALVRAPLTMASIAVLPVLIGLGVDYAIQYQARVEEEESLADPASAPSRAARLAAPTIATAGLATAVGFLVLLGSPVPMVRGFGVLLVVGIALAFFGALTAGTAALVASRRAGGRDGFLAAAGRGAAEIIDGAAAAVGRRLAFVGRFAGRMRGRALEGALARPGRVLAIGLALAAIGWAVDSQTKVESDIRELVPQDLPALRDLRDLQDTTDVSGEIDVIVEGSDLTQPEVVKWMRSYQLGLLKTFRYSSERGCGEADLCPALSLPDLFRTEQSASSREAIRALLDAVPPYFSQAVMTADRRTATLAFGIKLLPLDRQKEIIEVMRDRLGKGKPDGVTATVAGLPVLAADANAAMASPWRRLATLVAGLLAVFLVLLAVWRSRERAWVPLVPIALATGWSALILFALRIPLNPMSATLGALVIAISTEFAVLLSARFREERELGYDVREAILNTYSSTGVAVVASGTTAIAGFAVLIFSDVAMLRDFGLVTVIDLTVSLLGVLAVLPAVFVIAERRRSAAA